MSDNFHESHWGQCLELLSHLCHYSSSILLVTGPSGIGKTTMKHALMYMERENYITREVQATSHFNTDDLTEALAIPSYDDQTKDVLLLIDDAQNLSLEVIAVLLQLKQKAAVEGRLRIVLFATIELEQKILRSILRDDFAEHVHTIEIEPLTAVEVEAFLMQQWRKNNHDMASPFDRAKCRKIYSLSGGIPGKVQQIATDLLSGRVVVKHKERSLSPVMVGVTVSFGVLFCILAVLWPTADDKLIVKADHVASQLMPLDQVAAQTTEPELAPNTEVVAETPSTQPEPVVEAVAAPNYAEKIAHLEEQMQALQQQVSKEQQARQAIEQQYKQFIAKQQSIAPKVVPASKKSLSFSKHEKQILSLPSKNYTLQLMCMHEEYKVQSFIKRHKLEHKANYYKSNIKGKDWYVLVYGNYASKIEAQAAISKLPKALKQLHPHAREYNNIHSAIKKRINDE